MHELSVAISIIEVAEEEAARRGGLRIAGVHLKVGPLAGVMKDALLSAYELACEGTALAGTHLIIQDVPVVVFCPVCCERRELASLQDFSCSTCHTPTPEVLQGTELELTALELMNES